MARTDNRRNIVIIVTLDPATSPDTWRGRGVEIQDDGTLVLGTAKTSTASRSALLTQLIAPNAPGGTTPENSALYSTDDVFAVVDVPAFVVDAVPATAEYFPGTP